MTWLLTGVLAGCSPTPATEEGAIDGAIDDELGKADGPGSASALVALRRAYLEGDGPRYHTLLRDAIGEAQAVPYRNVLGRISTLAAVARTGGLDGLEGLTLLYLDCAGRVTDAANVRVRDQAVARLHALIRFQRPPQPNLPEWVAACDHPVWRAVDGRAVRLAVEAIPRMTAAEIVGLGLVGLLAREDVRRGLCDLPPARDSRGALPDRELLRLASCAASGVSGGVDSLGDLCASLAGDAGHVSVNDFARGARASRQTMVERLRGRGAVDGDLTALERLCAAAPRLGGSSTAGGVRNTSGIGQDPLDWHSGLGCTSLSEREQEDLLETADALFECMEDSRQAGGDTRPFAGDAASRDAFAWDRAQRVLGLLALFPPCAANAQCAGAIGAAAAVIYELNRRGICTAPPEICAAQGSGSGGATGGAAGSGTGAAGSGTGGTTGAGGSPGGTAGSGAGGSSSGAGGSSGGEGGSTGGEAGAGGVGQPPGQDGEVAPSCNRARERLAAGGGRTHRQPGTPDPRITDPAPDDTTFGATVSCWSPNTSLPRAGARCGLVLCMSDAQLDPETCTCTRGGAGPVPSPGERQCQRILCESGRPTPTAFGCTCGGLSGGGLPGGGLPGGGGFAGLPGGGFGGLPGGFPGFPGRGGFGGFPGP